MTHLLLIIFLIFAGQILGSLIGLIKQPKMTVLYGSLALAAAMMLGISFLELIPEALEVTSLSLVIVFFFVGIVLIRFIDKLLPHINPQLLKKENPSVQRSVTMLVIGMALHNLPEGLAIGIGFALTPALGIAVALGITAQNVPENLATIVPLYNLTRNRIKSFMITTATILFELVGFLFGYYILKGGSGSLLGASLAIAAGIMVYISIEELIPEAKIRENLQVGIGSIILGVTLVLIISFLS